MSGHTEVHQEFSAQDKMIDQFLQKVDHKLIVMSGKGGVGKSTVAANLALFLSNQGYRVGLLDVDVHGPSIAGLLGITDLKLNIINNKIQPHRYNDHLEVVSIQGLLDTPDKPLIWRGPVKIGIIRQFLADANWGALDFLIIDSPPGTGDEPLTVAQTITDCQAVIVTTPQEISLADVRKSIQFCKKVNMPILGIIENMSGFSCPTCGSTHAIFKSGGGKKTAQDYNLTFLGQLPIDPNIVIAGDAGQGIDTLNSPVNIEMHQIVDHIISNLPKHQGNCNNTIKIAIPVVDGKLSNHFGHCAEFRLITVQDGTIRKQDTLIPPPHAPGVIPNWVADQGCTDIIVGGLGKSALAIFNERGVRVLCGAPSDTPENLVSLYLSNELQSSNNTCNHEDHHHSCGGH